MKQQKSVGGLIHDVKVAREVLRCVGYKSRNFILPLAVGVVSTFFDAVGKLLLIPVLTGIITRDYGFVGKIPLVGPWSSRFLEGIPPDQHNAVLFGLLMIVVFTVFTLQYAFVYLMLIISSAQARSLSSLMQKAIFNRYLSFGKMFYDRSVPAEINNVILYFPELIVAKIQRFSLTLVDVFRFLVYLIILCVLSWKLTILAVIVFPALFLVGRYINDRIRVTSKEIVALLKDFSKHAGEAIANIMIVKLYRNEDGERRRFAAYSDRVAALFFSSDKKVNLLGPLQEFLMIAAIIIFVSVMTKMVLTSNGGNIASFFVYLYLLRMCGANFHSVTALWTALVEISGMCQRVLEVFSDQGKEFIPDGKDHFPGLTHEIVYKDVSYAYDERTPVLKGLDLTIKKGEVVAVVGASGSGKSTLVHLLLRYYDFSQGSIQIDGKDIRSFTMSSYYPHFSFVGQGISLFNDTLRNNLLYGLSGVTPADIEEAVRLARLSDVVEKLPAGLDTVIGDHGVCLSGGERQRLAIARALLRRGSIFLLDEATSALDSETERLVSDAITEAVRGKTAVIIAHRLSTIRNADKIAVLEQGQVVETGTLNELLEKKGRFYQYCEEQKMFSDQSK